jgi:isomerase DpgB
VVTGLAEANLAIGGSTALSGALIDEVNALCGRVEATQAGTVLLRLGGGCDNACYAVTVQTVSRWERALRRLERLPAATVAVVDGPCAGPAFDALLTADYRIAAPGAGLRIPPVGAGPWPGMALYRLANQVGAGRARSLALFGTELPAARAAEWGLLDEVVPDPAARSRAVLDAFAGTRGKELAIRRRLLLDAGSTSFEDALGAHLAACDRALRLAAAD